MDLDLKKISEPIENELSEFKVHFREAIRSKVALVDLVSKYILRQKGKKIRPILVLLSAKLCGEINPRTYTAATLVEMLHTATLIHDDVVDDAKTRRGLASINAVWKNKIAVLMGDFMLSRGLLLALENDECGFLKITACCELGAASTSNDRSEISLLSEFGENIGIAFQLRDDLLDYTGKKKIMGKSSGSDLKEKKFTLPLIHSLNNASKKEAKEIISVVKNGTYSKSRSIVMDFIKEHNGLEYTTQKTSEYCQIARGKIGGFKPSETKETLVKFVDFISDRIH